MRHESDYTYVHLEHFETWFGGSLPCNLYTCTYIHTYIHTYIYTYIHVDGWLRTKIPNLKIKQNMHVLRYACFRHFMRIFFRLFVKLLGLCPWVWTPECCLSCACVCVSVFFFVFVCVGISWPPPVISCIFVEEQQCTIIQNINPETMRQANAKRCLMQLRTDTCGSEFMPGKKQHAHMLPRKAAIRSLITSTICVVEYRIHRKHGSHRQHSSSKCFLNVQEKLQY